jgi:hypothetical protein
MARACVPWRAVSVGVGPVPILVRSTVSAGPWLSPCVGRLSVGGLARASDVADAQGFALFYPRPLRPVRASAPLRKAPTARQPTAHTGDRPRPPPPNRPALLAFPPHLPTGRTCEHKAEHAGPPTAESLPERCKRKPWPPPSCRSPLSPHPRPLVVTGHLTSSPPPPSWGGSVLAIY